MGLIGVIVMLNLDKFGQFISEKRLNRNMTQLQIANKLFVTPQAVSKWERGESFPDIETLVLLCYELSIQIDHLLNECFESILLDTSVTLENIEDFLHSSQRKDIIKKVIHQELMPITVTSIFYLLSQIERFNIIDKVIGNQIEVNCSEFIILLNPAERKRLLAGLEAKNCDMLEFIHLLSPLEKTRYTHIKEEKV